MRSHMLSVAALALLSVFVVISSPCLAASDDAGSQNAPVNDPSIFPANSDPNQAETVPSDAPDAAATIEEPVADEDVPPSEE